MTNVRFALKAIFSNVRLIGAMVVLVFAIGMLLVKDTTATNAFLTSSLNDIKMGMAADQWAPPVAPAILGYKAVDATQTTPFTDCAVMTDQQQVVFHWENTATELKTISKYFVGTPANPKMATYSNKVTSAKFTLAENENQLQVIAVDKRGSQSAPAICAVSADRIAPVVDVTLPIASVSGKMVALEAVITEKNLSSAIFEVKNSANQVVATGGALTSDETVPGESLLSYAWDASSLVSGPYTIEAKADDSVGHTATTTKQLALDTQAPESVLTMTVPVAPDSGFVANGGFETGLTGWTTQADALATAGNGAILPQQGNQAAVLGSLNIPNQVSLVSNSIASTSAQVQTIGFWYYLNPKQGVSNTEGMMVFVGNQLVHQEWLSNPTGSWRYLQLNVAGVADQTVTVAYSHDTDATTGGELYLDGFTTNQTFALSDLAFLATGADNVGAPMVHASYVVAGQPVELTHQAALNFTLAAMPDDQKVSFWSVDSVGNVEATKSFTVPTVTNVTADLNAGQPSPTPSPSPSPSPSDEPATESASLKPVVTIADKGDYKFDLSVTNLKPTQQVEYVIAYQHGAEGSEQIQDAIQGAGTVATDATSINANNLYFGTCSSTAGVVCTPHLGVTDIEIILTVTDPSTGVVTEYQFAYPGVWSTESSNETV